ncbi:MAG: ogr/Delta-like zinc finger family protein [Desulfotalea sp.]
MRVECERCNSQAIIYTRKKQSEAVSELFCCCKNPECGHSFVMDLAFSRTISPSALDFPAEIQEKIKTLTKLELKQLFAKLEPQTA